MNQQQFLDLINAAQTTLKQELLLKHPESKYQLLMLSRSFELLSLYLNQQNQHQSNLSQALEKYFQLPILSVDEGVHHLCQDLRHQHPANALEVLQQLNQADLMVSHPKVIKNG